jgi:hypothetical protein
MDGTVAQIKLNTGEMVDMSSFAGRASSIHVTEAFRIENNLIRRVEMIGTGVPIPLQFIVEAGAEREVDIVPHL